MTAIGAVSRPSNVVSFPVVASNHTRKAPPPIPELCGSTKPRTACTATIASAAVPPSFRTRAPAAAACGLATATIHSFAKIGSPRALAAREASTSGERNSNFVAKAVFASGNTSSETCCACTETEKSVMAAIIVELKKITNRYPLQNLQFSQWHSKQKT